MRNISPIADFRSGPKKGASFSDHIPEHLSGNVEMSGASSRNKGS